MTALSSTLKHFLAALILTPAIAIAHSSHDPVNDIQKNDQTISARQLEFENSQTDEQKLENLQNQIRVMESKMITLRNLIASDYPHIKEKMSKYKFDYMESVNETLAQLKKTLKQTDSLLNQ